MSWTDERVELLKKMWNEGHSASTIAKELGGVTRNAVIGKVHRLGLSNRNGPEPAPEPRPPKPPPTSEAEPGGRPCTGQGRARQAQTCRRRAGSRPAARTR